MDSIGSYTEFAGLGVVAGVFAFFAVIEFIAPMRAAVRGGRWVTNLLLFAIDTIVVRLAVPFLMVGTAALAQERGWGLLNLISLPAWVGILAAIVALDLALYLQHWARIVSRCCGGCTRSTIRIHPST